VPSRLIARLLQAIVVTALVGGTTAFVAFDKTVTVSVDGKVTEVRSFGRTVGDVLAHQGITVGPHDLVVPQPGENLESGEQIMVRFGRPVDLTIDGQSRRVWTTARSVDEALMMFGIRAEGAAVSASRSARISRGGIDLNVRMPHDLTFLADGRRAELTTNAETVREALAEAGITLRPSDLLNAGLMDMPTDEQVLAVTRVDRKLVTQEIAVPF
jgi:uncharacterized protein YabE (DUF348 family)